jgi:anaerobic selenocysteine-containing dehydrogenase
VPAGGAGLVLLTAPLLLGSGTMLARSGRLIDPAARGAIELAPGDAASRGIANGDAVIVQSRHGKVTAQARIVAAMPAGRAFLAENAPGVRTNLLLAWSDLLPRVEVTPV